MSDTEQIKQKVDIVEFISEYVTLKKAGVNYKGLCPFHSEKTPSFVVSSERQIWHCFGSCQDGGDVFKFLMRVENLEFPEALKILAKRAGVQLTSSYGNQTSDLKDKIYKINGLAAEFYSYILTKHPLGEKAREYLASRQITDNPTTLFQLGYAPNSWDSLINFMGKKGFPPLDLDQAGLVSKSSSGNFFDRFRGRIIFPLKDSYGNILGFAGRIMDSQGLPAGRQEAKYINTAETPVYIKGDTLYGINVTKDDIKKSGFAVVVEGEVDLIQSYYAGVKNVVAIKGSALTDGQVRLLKRFTTKITLSLDADYAGDAAAHRGIITADAAGFDIKVSQITQAKDPDQLIRKSPALWIKVVENAVPFYGFVIDSAIAKYGIQDASNIKQIVLETARFLSPIDNTVVKAHYLKRLANKLDIPLEALEDQIDKEYRKLGVKTAQENLPPATAQNSTPGRYERLCTYLLAILLQTRSPLDYLLLIEIRLPVENFSTGALQKIYGELLKFVKIVPIFSIKTFVGSIPLELIETTDRLYLQELPLNIEDDAEILTEVTKTTWELAELHLRGQLKAISLEIRNSDSLFSDKLQHQFNSISEALSNLSEEKKLLAETKSVKYEPKIQAP